MTVPVSRIALALLALASCSVDVSVPEGARISCAATTECQSGLRCLLGRQGGRCVSGADVCLAESGGELVPRAEGAPCQLPDGASGFCVDAACAVSRCGDGFLDRAAGEECDDGGRNSDTAPDACRTTCKRARCGDGVLD